MRIKVIIMRFFIAADAYFRSHIKGTTDNKNVLIVFQQLFGDSILIQNSLEEYTKIFSKADGYSIIMLAKPSNIAFMKETLVLPKDIQFEVVDFKRYLEDFFYYMSINKKYRGSAGTIIVPGTSLSGEVFSSASDAKRKIGLRRSEELSRPVIMALFSKIAYYENVRPKREDMVLQRHRKLINYLGNPYFKSGLPTLLSKERIIHERYAVMCPGASKSEKCWPIDRFASIVEYIISEFGLEVHLCGGIGEEKYADQLLKLTSVADKIVSHIGKTSFSDWSAIIQHAEFVVGNDSATIHLAAAARVPSICIAGAYDKFQFFPYDSDLLEDIMPVTIMKDMPCEFCRSKGYNAGYGNVECMHRIRAGLCTVCIDLITECEVKDGINRIMKEYRHIDE